MNVLSDWMKKHEKDGKLPVVEMNLNEVTHIGAVKNPLDAVEAFPFIENITLENDGWLQCSVEPGWLDSESYKVLAASTIVRTMHEKKYLINVEADMLPADVYPNFQIAEIMSADPAKLYAWMQHIMEMEPDQTERREWISGEIYKYLHPEHLVANPSETDE